MNLGSYIFVNQQYQNIPKTSLKVIEDLQNIYIEQEQYWKVHEVQFDIETESMLSTSQEKSDEEMVEIIPEENPYTLMIESMKDQSIVLEGLKEEIGSALFNEKFRETISTFFPTDTSKPELRDVGHLASEEQQRILDVKNITPWPIGHLLHSNFDVSEERQQNPALNFLTTKPISFRSIYVSKWAYNIMVAYILLLVSGGIVFLFSLLIGGLGETEYPMLVYAVEKSNEDFIHASVDNAYFYFESLLVLILKSGVLIMAQIFFLNSLFSLIGRWLKNHYATIVMTLIIVVAGYFFANEYTSMNGMHLNPFIYFDTWHIVDGWKSIVADSTKVNFINGSIILLVSGSLLFLMGLISGRKRV